MPDTMKKSKTIHWEQDEDGIVVLTLDDPNQSANTMTADYVASMGTTIDRLEAEKSSVTGVVLISAKRTFFAGGDIKELVLANPEDAPAMTVFANTLKGQLRRLETLGRPVVAAINGSALGGGLEIALATHHRIVVDRKGLMLGLPEATLGLLPGAGGIVRTVRLLGVQSALEKVLLGGKRFSPKQAKELGLVDEVVRSADELIRAAKAWIMAHPEAVQPWDVKGYEIPGGTPSTPAMATYFTSLPAMLRKQTNGAPMPAPRAIVAAAVEGSQVTFEAASLIETRYFVSLVTGQVAKNMMKAYFFDLQTINSGGSRPDGFEKFKATKVGVIGAGMMGAAIAYVSAKAGIDVVLKDLTMERANHGKAHAERLEAKAVAAGTSTKDRSKEVLDRILTTDDPADFAGVDFVIEAVHESVELKQTVLREVEQVVGVNAVLGSNTSTLPITTLAEGVTRENDFIGIHFFSPAEKMPLVEIITGKNTSSSTLAKAFDYTLQIHKTPIVVNDSRGFFTSRVIGAFLNEALAAVGEGINPAVVEQAAAQAGYPAPPLQLIDELTLSLLGKIRQETRDAADVSGQKLAVHGSDSVLDRMIDEYKRKGRSTGGGFYDYDEDGQRTGLWPGLWGGFGSDTAQIPFEDLQERMLFAEALETVRCFDEGVLNSVADANIGSLYGIGFPAWTGGVIQYINGYPGGTPGFVARAVELAQHYGAHFTPPVSLLAKAAQGKLLT